LGYFAEAHACFEAEPRVKEIAFLVERAKGNTEAGLEAMLSGRHSQSTDTMRDQMEIEFLLYDFAFHPAHMQEWLTCDREKRMEKFGPAKVRRRVAARMYPKEQVDLPDEHEYMAHSEGLHVTTFQNPSGGKTYVKGGGAETFGPPLSELLAHGARVAFAIEDLWKRWKLSNDGAPADLTTRTAFAEAWKWTNDRNLAMQQVLGLLPPRAPRKRPPKDKIAKKSAKR
jgi:hypothetical protein